MRRYAVLSIVLAFSTSTWGYYISSVTVSPVNPTTATEVQVTVAGNAPATNYHLDHTNLWRLGNMFFLDMYWASTGMGGMALVPYTHEQSLGTLTEGQYIVYARSLDEGLVRQSKSASFKVTKPTVPNPPCWPGIIWLYWWWPGTNISISFVQMQSIIIGGAEISLDFSFSNSAGAGP